jgi:lipoprotein-anchoring transpeptidase ErfK/SrfK
MSAAGLSVAALCAGVLSACTSASAGKAGGPAPRAVPSSNVSSSAATTPVSAPSTSASSTPAAPPPVRLTAAPLRADGLNPLKPITVSAAHGVLKSVTVVNESGKAVTGAYSADHTSWHTDEDLGYDRTYTLTARGTDSSGESTVRLHRSWHTVVPDNYTLPYFQTIYGSALENGATYGIGMIPVVQFDESIPDQAAAEKALIVQTTPHVDGSWTWLDDHTLHWRPQHFYKPGTVVTIKAMVYGKNFGSKSYKLFGQEDRSISFKIGQSHVSIANAKTHHVKVYFGGKLVRKMPTSMGQGGTVPGKNGQTIYLWTMPGTYTVIGHENPAIMSSDSYGLPANSPLGYAPEKVPWATKISTDGIYLHELDATVWAQGHENLSHGCLNLNQTNAKWFYTHSLVGDVVQVVHSGGPKIQLWQGGDWSVPWKSWLAGSALH